MTKSRVKKKTKVFSGIITKMKYLFIALKNITLCFVLSVFFSGIIFGIIYMILDKDSWIVLNVFPDKFQLNDFNGEFAANVYDMNIYEGQLSNRYPMKITLNNKEYVLKSYELMINFKESSYYNYLITNQPVRITSLDETISDTDITINNSERIISKDIPELSDYKIYDFSSDNNQNVLCEIQKEVELQVSGDISIYINNKIVASEGAYKIKVEKSNDVDSFLVFDLDFSKMRTLISEDDIQTLYLDGNVESFNGKASVNNGTLLYTYLSEQKEYDIGFVNVYGKSKSEKLDCKYDFDSDLKRLLISGKVSNIKVAETNLFFNLKLFMKDNLVAIIGAIFTAFIATYIPIVINKKSNDEH